MAQLYSSARLFSKTTKRDTFYFVYFILHIVITVLIDSSVVIPPESQLDIQKQIVSYHISQNKDFLLRYTPTWLKVAVWIELLFQLPFFVFAAISLLLRSRKHYLLTVAYGLEATLSTWMCLVIIAIEGPFHKLTDGEVGKLLAVYLPTFLIPLFITIDILTRQWTEDDEKKDK